jgi:hypothetical protein
MTAIGGANAAPVVWTFDAPTGILGTSQAFTSGTSTLTAYGFSRVENVAGQTARNLFINIHPNGSHSLAVCSIPTASGSTCLSGGSGDGGPPNGVEVDNKGMDEFIVLKAPSGSSWALDQIKIGRLDGEDDWYIYGGNTDVINDATLLVHGHRGNAPPGTATLDDPFGIVASAIHGGDSNSVVDIVFDDDAANHVFAYYFIAAPMTFGTADDGQNIEDFVLELFAGNETSKITAIPEPMTLALFGAGLLGCGLIRRRSGASIR